MSESRREENVESVAPTPVREGAALAQHQMRKLNQECEGLRKDCIELAHQNAALREQEKELRASLESSRSATHKRNEEILRLQSELASLREERDALLGMDKYGRHLPDCDIWRQPHIYQECTCGYWRFCFKCKSSPGARDALESTKDR